MKKVKVEITKPTTIDWTKPQWVQSKLDPNTIVLTTGFSEKENNFTGTALPCRAYTKGFYSQNWGKQHFELLTEDIPFTISNKED